MGTGSFPGVKSGRGVTPTTHPLLLPWSRKSRAIPLLPLWAVRPVQNHSASTIQLHLYSPYGPFSQYRASVPVQYSYTSTPPMGRTACTEPQCLYSIAIPLLPYGPYGLYRASVLVQGCTFTFTFYTSITYRLHYHSHYHYARSYNWICSLYCIYGFVCCRHLNVGFTGFVVGPVTDLELNVVEPQCLYKCAPLPFLPLSLNILRDIELTTQKKMIF